ncbi:class I SAM-dependent methyltransferase [Umezawaea sp. Da 62-37]|uniref:class I SAM-dependent methyltransferase n=1 Tax=Umezawaea sp. Da 62-37 TaxID=3075927 RepID=UPI0028F72DF4|nr:class I SAM-dependent methyltransferase [Umezawaea sp. Da 62-37]WNV84391.1 class I SAM-dependent methyltransferase [Umezawaea sp. Da 62-37]
MPTLEPHQYRKVAESFGADAERYDRTRPAYPEALIARIAAAGADVLDVGCGTGIEARQLRDAGCAVLGVEPDARMAEFARRSGLDVEVSTFETWDAAGRTFDVVASGQAWHWVDPVAGAARASEVLRPGGLLVAFWHVFDPPAVVADVMATVFQRVMPVAALPKSATDAYDTMCDRAAAGMREAGGFGEAERWRYEWEREYTRDEWLDLMPTTGALTRLPAEELAEVLEAVGKAVDGVGGGFTMRYSTVAAAAVRV